MTPGNPSSAGAWLNAAVAAFGSARRDKLAGRGGREAAIRAPLEGLLGATGAALGVPAVFHDEVRDAERRVRPDYGVSVGGAITGYVEVKAPGRLIDPAVLRGHDLQQWERQRDLPNLLYTNGTEWRLYRDGQPVGLPVSLTGGALSEAGASLAAGPELEILLNGVPPLEAHRPDPPRRAGTSTGRPARPAPVRARRHGRHPAERRRPVAVDAFGPVPHYARSTTAQDLVGLADGLETDA